MYLLGKVDKRRDDGVVHVDVPLEAPRFRLGFEPAKSSTGAISETTAATAATEPTATATCKNMIDSFGVFLIFSMLPSFLQLGFQPIIPAETGLQSLELCSQVGTSTDHFKLLIIQHGEDLNTLRAEPAGVIAKNGSMG